MNCFDLDFKVFRYNFVGSFYDIYILNLEVGNMIFLEVGIYLF